MRQRFAELVRAVVANTVASPEEAHEELRYLLPFSIDFWRLCPIVTPFVVAVATAAFRR